MFSSIITANAVTVVLIASGLSTTILKSDDRFQPVLDAIKADDLEALTNLLNPSYLLNQVLLQIGDVTIYRNRISLNGDTL